MSFNETLIKRRKEKGMTQDELADLLGVSRQSVSKWENGECYPETDKLVRLADVLETGLDELMGRTPSESSRKAAEEQEPNEGAKEEQDRAGSTEQEKPKGTLRRGLLLALAALVFGAACFLVGRYMLPFNNNSETVPTEDPTALNTEPPTEPPTPTVTEPAPSETEKPDEWFIDAAWYDAQHIMAMYGIDFLLKDSAEVVRSDDGDWLTVQFGSTEHQFASVSESFARDESAPDGWRLERCGAYVPNEESPKIDVDRDAFGSYFEYTITEAELTDGGYPLHGNEEDVKRAVMLALNKLTEKFRELDADDLMRCRDAETIGLDLDHFDPTTGAYGFRAVLAVYPADHRSFTLGFSDAIDGWLYIGDEYPSCRYFVVLNTSIYAARNEADGSILVCVDIPRIEEDG